MSGRKVPRGAVLPSARSRLLRLVKAKFTLDYDGHHGAPHWGRVRANGLVLSQRTGARVAVVEWFALIHDTQRENEYDDDQHGWRAARFAEGLNDKLLKLDKRDLSLLIEACEGHTLRDTHTNITIATCWDADRLDLGRVGIVPDPDRLCTDAARDPALLEWAYQRSIKHHQVDFSTDWGG